MSRNILSAILAVICMGLCASAQEGQAQLENALRFEEKQNYDSAITAYERLISSKPDEMVLLQAKVRLGRIYLEVRKDTAKARQYFEEGIRSLKYPEMAALSTVYNGRALLMGAASEKDFDSALAEFETVIRTYPNSSAVVEALFSGAAIYEMQHKYDQAKINYQSIVSQFPDSDKVPVAFLQLGRILGRQGNVGQALEAYQNVQQRYKGQASAVVAEEEATLLYRLFLLKKRSPAIFKPGLLAEKSNTFKLDDPTLMLWSAGNLNIIDKEKAFGYPITGEEPPKAITGQAASFVSQKGEVYRVAKSSLIMPNNQPLLVSYMKDGKKQPFDEITAVAANQYGDILVATHGPNGLFHVNRESGATTPFTTGDLKTKKIAVDSEGNFYVLNDTLTSLTIWDTRGKTLNTIQPTALGNKEIVDFTVDSFDNIYLLDKEGQFVIMGGLNQTADLKLKTIYKQQVMEQSKGSESKPMKELRAMAVSPSGSVFVVSKQTLLSFQ